MDLTFTVGDATVYETLLDACATIGARGDRCCGRSYWCSFDEPVVPLDGVDVADTITVERGSGAVAGSTERLGPQLFKWTRGRGCAVVSAAELRDHAVESARSGSITEHRRRRCLAGFTHIATFPDQALVAYSKPDHSEPIAQSRYGLTSLFQGRTWHEELGLYYYRARWYDTAMGSFVEKDPSPRTNTASLYLPFDYDYTNTIDPSGKIPESPTLDTQARNYVRFSGEDIRRSHSILKLRGITNAARDFKFYWQAKYLRFRLGYFATSGFDENLVRINFRALAHFTGKYNQPWRIDQKGEALRELIFGQPDEQKSVEYNRQFQRFRLFQIERIIDRFYDEWPTIMKLYPFKGAQRNEENNVRFDKKYVELHRSVTFEILGKWQRFEVPHNLLSQEILQAAFSSIYVLSEENTREGTLLYLEYWTREKFGWDSDVGYKHGGEPIRVRLPWEESQESN